MSVSSLPEYAGWTAKWLDSAEPMAREGFVLSVDFHAGT